MRRRALPIVVALLLAPVAIAAERAAPGPTGSAEWRAWIAEMKSAERGPFEAIRWFCQDGSVLPPKAYACVERGGGIQHGVLGPRARALRQQGFAIANVLAALDPERFVGPEAELDALRELLIERFLIGWDDGWIFRGARSYRGALQIEDEEAAAERIVRAMLGDPTWQESPRFFLLRETARGLPLPDQRDLTTRMRAKAALLGDADPGFAALRARLHAAPDAGDAARVRAYGRKQARAAEFEELAGLLDALFQPRAAALELAPLVRRIEGALGETLRKELAGLGAERAGDVLAAASRALDAIRRDLATLAKPESRLVALRASLVFERVAFASAQALLADAGPATRRSRLALLGPLSQALYGTGLIGERQLAAVREVLTRLSDGRLELGAWRAELGYLERVAEWSRRQLVFHFGVAMQTLDQIEPLAPLFEPDRLRGSPLLPWSGALDALVRDAQLAAGIGHRVLGARIGTGLRALNPGVARGVLRRAISDAEVAALPSDSIALLPETISDLPPVAAILTLGEGSSLSHVQLLARNLGIPNAVVSDALAERLAARLGESLEVAVSPGGVVQIDALPPEARGPAPALPVLEHAIRPDLEKLDLSVTSFVGLDRLRSTDSGRICGPKAANLGELRAHFGERVPDGFVIPFGVFRRLLDRPLEPGGPAMFDWLRARYAELPALEPAARAAATAKLLTRVRDWIEKQDPGAAFRDELRARLESLGGGVFVRSDTNVEDLPGFTGAGLNLTVPNVVGAERVIEAIARVWASPFSERAYAWRQAHMERPEWVLPSVLVQRAFPAEKSGVMVTLDVDTGDPGRLSVAVGEGVGGAVDGQSAESLRIARDGSAVRLLAQASAPLRAELDPHGGIASRPATGSERLLQPNEIDALIAFAQKVERFPALRTRGRKHLPADVEFAFRDGELALLQLRPFVESRRARESERLRALDAPARARANRPVALDDVLREDGA